MQDVTKDREKYIGGSDIPIIMGLSPFKTRFELAQEKAGIREDDFNGNEYTEYGNVMEPKIRDYLNRCYGYNFIEDKVIDGDIRYHADGWDASKGAVLEVKTTSQVHSDISGYKRYLVQLALGIDKFDAKIGLLAVYERPEDFDEVFVEDRLTVFFFTREEADELLLTEIDPAIERFRKDVQKLKNNPFLTEEELQPNAVVRLSNKLANMEETFIAAEKLVKEYKKVKDELAIAMEEHSIKKFTTNNGTQITLVPSGKDTVVKVFDEKTFTAENPELAEKYMIEKVKKGRTGYVRITPPKDRLDTAG